MDETTSPAQLEGTWIYTLPSQCPALGNTQPKVFAPTGSVMATAFNLWLLGGPGGPGEQKEGTNEACYLWPGCYALILPQPSG